jgi:hypothetical protein
MYIYFTYHLNKEEHCTLFPRPHKTLYCFDLTQTVSPCILRLYPLYTNLDTLCSTLFYCVILIILCFSLYFNSFTLISLDFLLPTSDYIYEPPHSFTYLITIEPDITLTLPFSHYTLAIGTDY